MGWFNQQLRSKRLSHVVPFETKASQIEFTKMWSGELGQKKLSPFPWGKKHGDSLPVHQKVVNVTPPKIDMEPQKMEIWKIMFLFNGVIFRFHVNFQWCSRKNQLVFRK